MEESHSTKDDYFTPHLICSEVVQIST